MQLLRRGDQRPQSTFTIDALDEPHVPHVLLLPAYRAMKEIVLLLSGTYLVALLPSRGGQLHAIRHALVQFGIGHASDVAVGVNRGNVGKQVGLRDGHAAASSPNREGCGSAQ
jgi:hypothetical protein